MRDRDRLGDRGRGMNRDGGYSDRDDSRGRERKDDRRERLNRWGDRDIDPIERREREKTLNDRLQQMAMANDPPSYANHDRPRDRNEPEGGMPPSLLERRMFPPHKGPPPMNQDIDDMYMRGPPDDFDHDMNGPPLMDDYPPMMDHPDYPPRIDGPMHPRIHRDDYEQERFVRGRRDFRDKFEPRGRGPPGPDFFPPRDVFGPRPMMRGGPDFPPLRPPLMRGPGPHKFHPRGPPMRGPRPNPPWKDRPNFGPRFEHPDFHRGPPGPPGPLGMFDEPPHLRHRGRFDDRRRPRPDFNHENVSDNERFEKRSRWGDSQEENRDSQSSIESRPASASNNGENKGGNTPLHDEPLNREPVMEEEHQNEEVSLVNEIPIEQENPVLDSSSTDQNQPEVTE